MKIRNWVSSGICGLLTTLALPLNAWSLEQIVRPYQSIRSSGMGGLVLTTGIYDDNFFGNPARVLANPSWRVSLFDITAEVSKSGLSHISDLTSDGDFYDKMSATAGDNNHVRIQTAFPAFYIPPADERKMGFAFGLLLNTQADVILRNSFEIDPMFVTDLGPAFTAGRKFLDDDSLGIGLTTHLTYRFATTEPFTFLDLIKGKSLKPSSIAGQGAHLDFDLGATYRLPLDFLDAKYSVAFAVNNLLGGAYSNLSLKLVSNVDGTPPAQPRSLGFGISAVFPELSVFTNTQVGIEMRDIGNNPNGGLFRTVHIGGETRLGVLTPRLGINQGYLTAGLGLDLKVLTLDLATYGEEMSLNPGGMQDRRYLVKLAFQI